MKGRPGYILPLIVIAQFAGTSLWFAGNAILPDIQETWQLGSKAIGLVSSSVQIGFISGTFLFAILSISDRFRSPQLFFISSLLGALANALITVIPENLTSLLILRFFTGFFLAGIYPVGMKLAAGWYKKGLGMALGFLVGALVVGKAFPHLIVDVLEHAQWTYVLWSVSITSVIGGLLILLFVPEGQNTRKSTEFNVRDAWTIFRNKSFRASAFGYFGHMWELYAFWTFIPFLLTYYATTNQVSLPISWWTFVIMGMGFLGCALGGLWSTKIGSAKVAFITLTVSCLCCIFSPIIFTLSPIYFISIMLIWGFAVVADSPQFSSLNATFVDLSKVGTGLTIVTSLGFLISVFSIELLNSLKEIIEVKYLFLFLIPGPIIGLWSLRPLLKQDQASASA
jgi:MFS family permease